MERCFARSFDALPSIFQFVSEFLAACGLPATFEIDLIIEELFTNMVKFNAAGRSEIAIGLEHERDVITIRLCDFDVEEFDFTAVPEPDLIRHLRQPRRGGLGLRLVRRCADSLRYEYVQRNSIVTASKRVGA